jgi:short-subunit dehydrogenase
MFNTNVNGLMYCTRVVVPTLKARQAGHIINISSIAGLNGIVQGSGYSATKFAVRGISHSLYAELREDGIKVSCVYPGSVATNFFDEVEGVTINPNMLQPQDVATLLVQLLQSSPNFLTVDVEIRPLQPKGKK